MNPQYRMPAKLGFLLLEHSIHIIVLLYVGFREHVSMAVGLAMLGFCMRHIPSWPSASGALMRWQPYA